MDPSVTAITDFWFSISDLKLWFMPSDSLDNDLRTKFGSLVAEARDTSALDSWTASPQGMLALLLLLDQFPRNIYRGTPLAYASDAKARDVAARGIAQGFDRQLDLIQQPFVYLPFMHEEAIAGQLLGGRLYAEFSNRCGEIQDKAKAQAFAENSRDQSEKHMACILRFGRFPARNKALGREPTQEELDFLKEHPAGF